MDSSLFFNDHFPINSLSSALQTQPNVQPAASQISHRQLPQLTPCSTSGIPYERALHSLHGVLCARSRPTAQLSSAQCTQLQITSAVGFSPSAQMQQTASIPTAHHSPFGLCLLLVLLLLAVATYSDYFTLTSVHVCLSCSSGVLYRSSNADYVGESSPLHGKTRQ